MRPYPHIKFWAAAGDVAEGRRVRSTDDEDDGFQPLLDALTAKHGWETVLASDDRFGYLVGEPPSLRVVYEDDPSLRRWAESRGYTVTFDDQISPARTAAPEPE